MVVLNIEGVTDLKTYLTKSLNYSKKMIYIGKLQSLEAQSRRNQVKITLYRRRTAQHPILKGVSVTIGLDKNDYKSIIQLL